MPGSTTWPCMMGLLEFLISLILRFGQKQNMLVSLATRRIYLLSCLILIILKIQMTLMDTELGITYFLKQQKPLNSLFERLIFSPALVVKNLFLLYLKQILIRPIY